MSINQFKVTASSDVEALIQKFNGYEQRDAYFQCVIYNGKLTLRFDITFKIMSKAQAFSHYQNLITYCNDILRKAKNNSYKYGKVVAYHPCVMNPEWEGDRGYKSEDSIGGLIMFDLAVPSEDVPASPVVQPKPVAPQALPKVQVKVQEPIVIPRTFPTTHVVDLDGETELTTAQLYAQFIAQWNKVCPGLGPWTLVKNENGTYFSCSVSEGLAKKAITGKFKFAVAGYRGFPGSVKGLDGRWLVYRTENGNTLLSYQSIHGVVYKNVMNVFLRHPENGMVQLFLKAAFYKA